MRQSLEQSSFNFWWLQQFCSCFPLQKLHCQCNNGICDACLHLSWHLAVVEHIWLVWGIRVLFPCFLIVHMLQTLACVCSMVPLAIWYVIHTVLYYSEITPPSIRVCVCVCVCVFWCYNFMIWYLFYTLYCINRRSLPSVCVFAHPSSMEQNK